MIVGFRGGEFKVNDKEFSLQIHLLSFPLFGREKKMPFKYKGVFYFFRELLGL